MTKVVLRGVPVSFVLAYVVFMVGVRQHLLKDERVEEPQSSHKSDAGRQGGVRQRLANAAHTEQARDGATHTPFNTCMRRLWAKGADKKAANTQSYRMVIVSIIVLG